MRGNGFLFWGCAITACLIAVYGQNDDICASCLGYVPDPENCCFYYSCVTGIPIRLACPPGLHFNAKLLVCDWPYNANCTGGEVVTPSPTTKTTPTPTFPNTPPPTPPNTPVPTFPNTNTPAPTPPNTPAPTNPPTTPTTPPPTLPPLTPPPPTLPNTPGSPVTPPPTTTTTPTPTTQTTPTPQPGITYPCESKAPATLPYPGDCAKYYYCYDGYPYVVQCDSGQYFSEKDHSCIVASECPSGGGSAGGNDFKCPDEYGTYVYPGDTTRYYYCYQRVPYIVQCYTNQHYEPSIHACAANS